MLEDLRAKMAPNMERARLEGAQAYKVRVETLSSHQEDLKREVERETPSSRVFGRTRQGGCAFQRAQTRGGV